jgi:pimeloyl-ACP methyl ester carboxylesterase
MVESVDYTKDFAEGFAKTSVGSVRFMHHEGAGKKLLFLHGVGGSTLSWKKLFTMIPEGYDVTAIDLLGHGGSDAPDVVYTIPMQVQAVEELLIEWEWEGYIIGHSYGGWIAAVYAARFRRAEGIVLIDAMGMDRIFLDMKDRGTEQKEKDGLFARVMQINTNRDHVIRSIVYGDHSGEWLSKETFVGFGCRTLIIWGTDDNEIDYSYGKYLSELIPKSDIVGIDKAGHSPFFTKSERCWELIENFVK